jgi:hypothetical protein
LVDTVAVARLAIEPYRAESMRRHQHMRGVSRPLVVLATLLVVIAALLIVAPAGAYVSAFTSAATACGVVEPSLWSWCSSPLSTVGPGSVVTDAPENASATAVLVLFSRLSSRAFPLRPPRSRPVRFEPVCERIYLRLLVLRN